MSLTCTKYITGWLELLFCHLHDSRKSITYEIFCNPEISACGCCQSQDLRLVIVARIHELQSALCMLSIVGIVLGVEWADSRCFASAAAQYVRSYHQATWHGTRWRIPHGLSGGLHACS